MDDISIASDGFLDGVFVLGKDYVAKTLVDSFISFTWSERYDSPGEFTLTIPIIESYVEAIRINDYLAIKESKEYMVVETSVLSTDVEDGDMLQFEGRTLSSILDRRIVWTEYKKTGEYNFQQGIKELIEQNAISPSDEKRKIPGLAFKMSENKAITELTSEFSVEVGANLLSVIEDKCKEKKVGFRMLPSGEGGFEFELYMGKDRSSDQDELPVVVFSDSYENLLNSNYVQSEKEYVSNALVKGSNYQGEVYRKEERTGLARREMYVTIDGETDGPSLLQKAKEEIAKKTVTEMFGGEIDIYHQFIFGRDYFVGDIVQVANKYGFKGRCRITELLRSRDAGGPVLTPSFAVVDKNNEEVSS